MHKKVPRSSRPHSPNEDEWTKRPNEEMASEKGDQAKNGANPTINLGKFEYSKRWNRYDVPGQTRTNKHPAQDNTIWQIQVWHEIWENMWNIYWFHPK